MIDWFQHRPLYIYPPAPLVSILSMEPSLHSVYPPAVWIGPRQEIHPPRPFNWPRLDAAPHLYNWRVEDSSADAWYSVDIGILDPLGSWIRLDPESAWILDPLGSPHGLVGSDCGSSDERMAGQLLKLVTNLKNFNSLCSMYVWCSYCVKGTVPWDFLVWVFFLNQ